MSGPASGFLQNTPSPGEKDFTKHVAPSREKRRPTPDTEARDTADVPLPSSSDWQQAVSGPTRRVTPPGRQVLCVFLVAGEFCVVFQAAKCGTGLWGLHVGKQRSRQGSVIGQTAHDKARTKRPSPPNLSAAQRLLQELSRQPGALFRTQR